MVLVLLVVLAACTATSAAGRRPAPAGGRSPSSSASAHPWLVVALGDSVTTGGPCGCTPFPELYGRQLAQVRGMSTRVRNLGVNGEDSGGLLVRLEDAGSREHAAARAADIDLITIGANDFGDQHDNVTAGRCSDAVAGDCVQDDLATMRDNLARIIAAVHRLRRGQPTAVLVTGYWNVFEDGSVARRSFPALGIRATQRVTAAANAVIRSTAQRAGTTYVDLYAPFNGPESHGDTTVLLGPDGDHPNAAGQALIARRLVAAGLPGLVDG